MGATEGAAAEGPLRLCRYSCARKAAAERRKLCSRSSLRKGRRSRDLVRPLAMAPAPGGGGGGSAALAIASGDMERWERRNRSSSIMLLITWLWDAMASNDGCWLFMAFM